jgi:hypothetical protein
MRRDNANGAGTKSPTTRKIPVSVDLIRPSRLPACQVRDLDGDYVVGILRGPSARASTGLRRKAGSTSMRTGCGIRRRHGCCDDAVITLVARLLGHTWVMTTCSSWIMTCLASVRRNRSAHFGVSESEIEKTRGTAQSAGPW